MGLSLEEYAKQNPPTENEQREFKEAAKPLQEELARTRAVEDLKAGILSQIWQGDEPQYILYAALEAIGILTNDADWAALGQAELDKIYGDLRQRALFRDDLALEHERLEGKQADFLDKLQKRTARDMRTAQNILDSLDALQIMITAAQIPPADSSTDLNDF